MSDGTILRWSDYRAMPWRNGGGTTREVASGTIPDPAPAPDPASATREPATGEPATREPAARSSGSPASGADAFDWRISVADVAEGGPFSAFPGIDRVITLVEGSGMVLTVDDAPPRTVEPLTPFAFSGDARTGCRLEAGPVRDMNVMTRRGRASARVRLLRVGDGGTELSGGAGEIVLALAVTEGVTVGEGDTAVPLGRLDCARATPRLSLRGAGTVAEIRISPAR